MGASLHLPGGHRRQRPPAAEGPSESTNPLDRTVHSGSRKPTNRAYSKYDYPTTDPLGGTGHGTGRTAFNCYGSNDSSHHDHRCPIPAEITIKLDDCVDDTASKWRIRKAPPPMGDNNDEEGEETKHTTTTTTENRHKKNDNDNEEEEQQHKTSSSAASHRHDSDQEDTEASAPPPPSYDECVHLGLFFDNDNEERCTKATSSAAVQEENTTSSRWHLCAYPTQVCIKLSAVFSFKQATDAPSYAKEYEALQLAL